MSFFSGLKDFFIDTCLILFNGFKSLITTIKEEFISYVIGE